MRQWDQIDVWAENIGRLIPHPRILSEQPRMASAKEYDKLWRRLWKEEKQKPIQL